MLTGNKLEGGTQNDKTGKFCDGWKAWRKKKEAITSLRSLQPPVRGQI